MIVHEVNLLLYAYDSTSPFHQASSDWWAALLSGVEPVGLCPVVVFAFLRLSTHGKVFDSPLTLKEASERIASRLARPNVRLLNPRRFAFAKIPIPAPGPPGPWSHPVS